MRRATFASLVLLAGCWTLGFAGSSCITKGYPLGASGTVDLRREIAGSLYASALGSDGRPVLARQRPFETNVALTLSEAGDPAYGAFVDVRVQPAEALVLSSAIGEADGPSCVLSDGNFRCTATKDGVAQFVVASEAAWSGEAHLLVSWSSATGKDEVINVAPAGLPSSDKARNFELVIGGVPGTTGDVTTQRIAPSFVELACTVDAKPSTAGKAWPPGKIRARTAHARVTRPIDSPEVVENAPVLIEALDSAAAISTDKTCADANRSSRLPTTLDNTGQTPEFYLCFSDEGGPVRFEVSSGQQAFERDLTVAPEPYLLRVKTSPKSILVSTSPQSIFTIEAFDLNSQPMKMSVDLATKDDAVLQLLANTSTLDTAGQGETPASVSVLAVSPGQTQLRVTPLLLSNPFCLSDLVTVQAAP